MDIRGSSFKRAPLLSLSVLIAVSFFSPRLCAEQTLAPTEISGWPLTDIGFDAATRPSEKFEAADLRTDERPELSEALDTIPGVQARTEGSPALNLRGSQSAARTLVLENGVPLNFSDGVGFNPLFASTENLGSIEILKGPTSSLFGHDALAGVVQLNTRKLDAARFFASEGSFNTQQVFAGAPFAGGRFQATLYDTHTDNNFQFRVPRLSTSGIRSRDDSETSRVVLEGGSSGNFGGNSGGGSDFEWRTFHLYARQIGSTPGSLDFPVPTAFNNWLQADGFEFQKSFDEKIQLGSRSSYKYIWQNYSGSSPGATTGLRESVSLVDKFSGGNLEVFDDFTYEAFSATYLPSGNVYAPLNEVGLASFYEFSPILAGQAALRFSSEKGGLIPSVGLVGFRENWKYFINWSMGYHPASVTQKFAQFTGFSGNPQLNPEQSYEVDLGFERNYGSVKTHFEAFGRDIYNIIESQVLVPGTFTPQNVGHANAYGFELAADTPEPFSIGAAVDYLSNVEVETNQPIPLSPQWQVELRAGYETGPWDFRAQFTAWSSEYDISPSTGGLVAMDSWMTLDLFAAYRVSKNLQMKLAILDIFDTPKELTLGYPDPQRSFTLSAEGSL